MMLKKLGINIDVSGIPEHMVDGVMDYLEYGAEPGHFLRAILENNLVRAFNWADVENERAMKEWAGFLYNEIPSAAWGSEEKVNAWMKARREGETK